MKVVIALAVLALVAVSQSFAAVEKIVEPTDVQETHIGEEEAPPPLPEGVSLDEEGFPVDAEGKRLTEADLSPEEWRHYGRGYGRGFGGYGGYGRGRYGGYGGYGGYRRHGFGGYGRRYYGRR
ncbi:unnamed protein product [Cyprideis torosa]|uniref:Uncharacterized protein n=1 Tax=Cyprideis torosa TaxID=163714 RepID=A0A7R8WJ74_9CRUS|nr:unnamed protein product [Cyprideis torosa]CAG0895312.1 unnamed protein product [Cyprideis torosa]